MKKFFAPIAGSIVALTLIFTLTPIGGMAQSWIGGFVRDSSGNITTALRSGTNTAGIFPDGNSDGNGAGSPALLTADFNLAFNGASWDRLRAFGSTDGLGSVPSGALVTDSYNYGYNGATFDRLRSYLGIQRVSTGGQTLSKIAATVCTNVAGSSILSRIWSAGTETAVLSIYDESTATCAAADLVWTGTPSTTPIYLEAPMNAGVTYKFGSAPAVNDYLTL